MTRERKRHNWIVFATTLTYLIMVLVNALANIIPIGGVGTGQISDRYGNLFAPAPITFAIWALIYFMLLVYVLRQIFSLKSYNPAIDAIGDRIAVVFSVSSIANTLWILAWHNDILWLTLLLMLVMLACLIRINEFVLKMELNRAMKAMIKLPFNIYFGWITIATIANVTTMLVKYEWNAFGMAPDFWTAVMITVGTIIGVLGVLKYKAWAYGLVFIWAYYGIYLKHTSPTGFEGAYPIVITTSLTMMAVVGIAVIVLLIKRGEKAA